MDTNPAESLSSNGSSGKAVVVRLPSGITQVDAIKAFEKAGGVLRKSKRGHAVLKMPNGRLVSLPHGTLKKGLLERQIRLAGLTVEEFLDYLKGAL